MVLKKKLIQDYMYVFMTLKILSLLIECNWNTNEMNFLIRHYNILYLNISVKYNF
jgi:thiaminase